MREFVPTILSTRHLTHLGLLMAVAIFATAPVFGQEPAPNPALELDDLIGSQRALIIGVDKYAGLPQLPNCVFDCKAIATRLRETFQFAEVTELYDEQATREGILRTMRQVAASMEENDSLLIYFSGHGVYDDFLDRGYWVPVDGSVEVDTCIPSGEIKSYVKATAAKRVWVVCDSCFSGSLFREKSAFKLPPVGNINEYVKRALKRKCRIVLSAGGNEPVTADGFNGHSMFAYYFLRALELPISGWTDSTQVFNQLKVDLANNTEQTPQQGVIFGAGHDQGEFILVAKDPAKAETETAPALAQPDPPVEPEVMEPQTAAQTTVADDPSRVPLPGGIDLELVSVQGSNGAFWVGVSEVTQAQWTAVASLPPVGMELIPSPSKNVGDDYPVENISVTDCKEFCARLTEHSGRSFRLPTEAEWIAAAGGTGSGVYPWGNSLEDAAKYANCKDLSSNKNEQTDTSLTPNWDDGFAVTAPVGSFAPNANGLYDIVGNVAEWIAPSGYRGGSWGHGPDQLRIDTPTVRLKRMPPSGFVGFRVVTSD